jgi:hypothetical protein
MKLRDAGISDSPVLGVIEKMLRRKGYRILFRGPGIREHALLIGTSQTVSQPDIAALMTEKLGRLGTLNGGSCAYAGMIAGFD